MSVPDWVKHYISIPYEEVDCYGLVRLVYKEMMEINLEADKDSPTIFEGWSVVYNKQGEPTVNEFDVLMFRDTAINRHVGIAIDAQYMIHSIRGVNSCLERWNRLNWKGRLVKVYRHQSRL